MSNVFRLLSILKRLDVFGRERGIVDKSHEYSNRQFGNCMLSETVHFLIVVYTNVGFDPMKMKVEGEALMKHRKVLTEDNRHDL